jgi:hypothetical protein
VLPPLRKFAALVTAPVTAAVLYLIVHGMLHYDDLIIARDSGALAGFLILAFLMSNLTHRK